MFTPIPSASFSPRFRLYAFGLGVSCLLAFAPGCTISTGDQQASLEAYNRLTEDEKRSPEWAVAGLDVAPGLEATLFAAEPMIVSPSNMDVDHRGRIWAVDVWNYRAERNPANPYREEGDRILILEDTTGDGTADKQTVFYQGTDVNVALGITVLGNRVIVASSPHVLVFTDEDGDDQADTKEVLFTGMSGVDHDHGAHAVVFGPDGKYYFNFGNSGEQIQDRDGSIITDLAGNRVEEGDTYRQGMVFRSNPDGSEFEVLGHNFRNNYEVAVDAFGTMWQSDNDDDGNRSVRINYVMEYGNYGYVDEVTGAGWRSIRTNLETEVPDQHWHQNDPGVVPNLLVTGAGSPTGILVYEGDLLPSEYQDQIIHADAGPNVVRAYPVQDDGAGYTASMANIVQGTRDQWFRPTDVAVAPDGSLFISDWYDPAVGGHEMADSVGRGRVFRVAPPGTEYQVPALDLSTAEGAARALISPNHAARYLGWTALNEMQAQAEPALLALWQSAEPRDRARALWLLTKIEGRGDHYVSEALADDDENIRITGLRAARQLDADIIPYLQQLVRDPSPQVRREVSIALRHNQAPEAAGLWADLALQHDGEDRWYLEALGIGADGQEDRFFNAWRERAGENWNTAAGRDIVWRIRSASAMPLMAEVIADQETDVPERLRYFRAFDFHAGASKDRVLLSLLDAQHPEQAEIRAMALKHVSTPDVIAQPGVRAALDETLAELRGTQMFVDLVSRFDLRDQNEALMEIVMDEPAGPLALEAMRHIVQVDGYASVERVLAQGNPEQSAALLAALGRIEDAQTKDLLERIVLNEQADLNVRRVAAQGLGRGWSGEGRLLRLVQDGTLPTDLESTAAGVLLSAGRLSIREAAAEHLGTPAMLEGSELPPIQELAARTGNAAAGKGVFDRVCQSCHVVNNAGINFGPELSEIGDKLPEEGLYLAILDPNAGVSHGYEGQEVRLADGNQVVGFFVSETPDAVELRLPGGTTQRYDKSDISSMTKMETSLMPAGLHQMMTEQELVDLVEYMTTLRHAEP